LGGYNAESNQTISSEINEIPKELEREKITSDAKGMKEND
jgi:hypothetical protein